uniref:hypothetical protein n=1 Tax=Roseovarius sp. BRH_c41 TaxID=1629709 RepID=UPI000A86CEFC|nr:hypothetical protein [Roseovarius sp. BRH_c41]
MFRIAVIALMLSTAPALSATNPCLDYLGQREASAKLAIAVLVVQVGLLIHSEAEGISDPVRDMLRQSSDDLAAAVAQNSETMTSIMETTICR